MLKSVYLSNDDIKVVRNLIIFFIVVFTFLMVIGNKYFIPKNGKQTNSNMENFLPSYGGRDEDCQDGKYCGHGGQVTIDKNIGGAGTGGSGGSGGGGGGGGSGGSGGSGDKEYANCDQRYNAEKNDKVACPMPCSPGEHESWSAGEHGSQTDANTKLLDKYKDNLFYCFKGFFNIGNFVS